MKGVIILIGVMGGVLSAASYEFPICTAPGNQFYPDVCWDGGAFWVVWQDDSLGTIRGVRVSEDGEFLTDEVELLNKGTDPGPVRYPCVAAGPDRIAVEARVMAGYNEFGTPVWGVMHREFSFDGKSLHPVPARIFGSFDMEGEVSAPIVLFGKRHFFSFFTTGYETDIDAHRWSMCIGLENGGEVQQDIWMSSTLHCDWQPSIACWDGELFLVITSYFQFGTFLFDTLAIQGIGGQFEWDREAYNANDHVKTIKFQSLVPAGKGYLFVSEINTGGAGGIKNQLGFDILDSGGMPIKDSVTILDFRPSIETFYPDAAFGGENFIAVWENRFENETTHLYALEVDTLGEIIKSGYIVQKSPVDQHPAIAFGEKKYFLVWSDNHEGEFNIYGMLFDTLEVFEGVDEKIESPQGYVIKASPNPFQDQIQIQLVLKGGKLNEEKSVLIFDALGRRVSTLALKPGEEVITWDGKDAKGNRLSPGIYFLILERASGLSFPSLRIAKID